MADYFEMVIDGDLGTVRGFVSGCLAGAKLDAPCFTAKDFGIEHDGLAREVAEKVRLVENRMHLVTDRRVVELVQASLEHLRARGSMIDVEVSKVRPIASAYFDFSWKVYSREEAERCQALCAAKPASIELEDYAPSEEVHKESNGESGMYAPVHAYTARASGRARGNPEAVVRWAARLRDNAFIKVGLIHLEYEEGAES